MNVTLSGVRVLGAAPTKLSVVDGKFGEAPTGTVIDCAGLVLLPAFVDLHTHLREPGGEDAETIASGAAAAAAGGYSDVFAMANCDPVTDSADRVEHVRRLAEDVACRVHAVGAITTGLAGNRLAPLESMAAAGARVFSDDGRCVDDAAVLRSALAAARRTGTVVAQHAQCGALAGAGQINEGPVADRTGLTPWPGLAEQTIVARDALLAADTGGRLHVCHVSTARTVEVIRWAKDRGWPVTAEVTPHHLLLTDAEAAGADPAFKVNPPLRGPADVAALVEALRDGTIDAVATDHAPHPAARKTGCWPEAAFGLTGLETALAVVAEVLAADWPLIAERLSAAPARIGGLPVDPPRPGAPATFTLVDPDADWVVDPARRVSRSANTPFAARRFRHRPIATVVAGRVTADVRRIFPKEPT